MRERYGWYEGLGVALPGGRARRGSVTRWAPTCPSTSGSSAMKRSGSGRSSSFAFSTCRVTPRATSVSGSRDRGPRSSRMPCWRAASSTPRANVIHPPPVSLITEYERSAQLLQQLRPARLLTAHYDVIEGEDVERFLDETLDFVGRARCRSQAGARRATREHARRSARPYGRRARAVQLHANELAATVRGVLNEQGVEAR